LVCMGQSRAIVEEEKSLGGVTHDLLEEAENLGRAKKRSAQETLDNCSHSQIEKCPARRAESPGRCEPRLNRGAKKRAGRTKKKGQDTWRHRFPREQWGEEGSFSVYWRQSGWPDLGAGGKLAKKEKKKKKKKTPPLHELSRNMTILLEEHAAGKTRKKRNGTSNQRRAREGRGGNGNEGWDHNLRKKSYNR